MPFRKCRGSFRKCSGPLGKCCDISDFDTNYNKCLHINHEDSDYYDESFSEGKLDVDIDNKSYENINYEYNFNKVNYYNIIKNKIFIKKIDNNYKYDENELLNVKKKIKYSVPNAIYSKYKYHLWFRNQI